MFTFLDSRRDVYKNEVFIHLFAKMDSFTAESVRRKATGTNNGFGLGTEPSGVHEPSRVENCLWSH
jgi:hypothetical protein